MRKEKLDRENPGVAARHRFESAIELLDLLAAGLLAAGLDQRIAGLLGQDITGRGEAIAMLKRACSVRRIDRELFQGDEELRDDVKKVMASGFAGRALVALRDTVLCHEEVQPALSTPGASGPTARTSPSAEPSSVSPTPPAPSLPLPAETGMGEETSPATAPPVWADLGDAKQAILTVLGTSDKRLQGRGIATKAGYKYGTLRHHFGKLQNWNYIDKTKDGYLITPTGAALVSCERV